MGVRFNNDLQTMRNTKFAKFIIFTLVLLLALSQEGECRRKILKGRKAITRTYYRYAGIPAWAVVLLIGLGELVIGGLLFVLLKFLVLDQAVKPRYIRTLTSPRISP